VLFKTQKVKQKGICWIRPQNKNPKEKDLIGLERKVVREVDCVI